MDNLGQIFCVFGTFKREFCLGRSGACLRELGVVLWRILYFPAMHVIEINSTRKFKSLKANKNIKVSGYCTVMKSFRNLILFSLEKIKCHLPHWVFSSFAPEPAAHGVQDSAPAAL